MITFKCKMCGGDLHPVENATTCECEFCGSVQTIPTADNEKKMNLFSRAQRLLRACDFDKAAGVYESIVAEFPEEAEAYWGLVLCKYGIEYVDDPNTGRKIPTCHCSSFNSVMDDSNFEQATENADPIARRIYREEAKNIEELRKRIIEVSSKEESYDIFICYKETDENGNRTLDSVLAQDIYDSLTEKGYRVFFSRITLEDKLGKEYEPYIFAALNSAKVMLVVGTDYEYFNAVWVKNEWSRFLKLIASGERKALIPCYKNIDAYDMPKEFTKLQAQDMGKIGAMQDLIRGIEKLLSVSIDHTSKENSERIKKIENIRMLARRANETADMNNGLKYYEQLLLEEPNDWEAVFYSAYFYYSLHTEDDNSFTFSKQLKQTFDLISEQVKDEQAKKDACKEVFEKTAVISQLKMQIASNIVQALKQRTVIQTRADALNILKHQVPIFEEITRISLACTEGILHCKQYDTALEQLKLAKSILELVQPEHVTQNVRDYNRRINELTREIELQKKKEEEVKRQEEEMKRKKEAETRQKRIEEYWATHSEEKKSLESERDNLNSQINEIESQMLEKIERINKELSIASVEKEETVIQERITRLKNELASLGIFKRKEKKDTQNQINEAEIKRSEIHNQITERKREAEKRITNAKNESDQKIGSIKARIAEIDNELKRDR